MKTPIWAENMNPEQLEAINHQEGPCLVLAVSGAGKTRCLVNRIARLVDSGVDPARILAVTFSKKAQEEMNDRLEKMGITKGRFSTWHSLCRSIVYADPSGPCFGWSIGNETEGKAKYILKDVVGYKGIRWDKVNFSRLQSFIGICKANLWYPKSKEAHDLAKEMFPSEPSQALRAFAGFNAAILKAQVLTYDDMLVFAYEHLSNESNRLEWASKWDYVLQDEVNDVNAAQVAIADLLVKNHNNYMMVGDIQQSIFGFRGTSPAHVQKFATMPGVKVINMHRNYRSGDEIIETANDVISKAAIPPRVPMTPQRNIKGSVDVVKSADTDREAEAFVSMIEELSKGRASYDEITALYRLNAQSRALEEALIAANIPYQILGSGSFYDRKEVRNLLAYLNVASDLDTKGDNIKWSINSPYRFLGTPFVETIRAIASEAKTIHWPSIVAEAAMSSNVKEQQKSAAKTWATIIESIAAQIDKKTSPREILTDIVTRTQYYQWLENEEGDETIENSPSANVRELIRISERCATVDEFLNYIKKSMEDAKKARDKRGKKTKRVTLMSIHKSKGLEWPHVFVCGVNEDILPHKKGDSEEERRLAYVAITRARDSLTLSWVRKFTTGKGTVLEGRPSRFLTDAQLVEDEGPKTENGSLFDSRRTVSNPVIKASHFVKQPLPVRPPNRTNWE